MTAKGPQVQKLCAVCGKVMDLPIRLRERKTCSEKCKGVTYRGKNSLPDVDGYHVYLGNHGYAVMLYPSHRNRKHLHVYLAEKALGRSLKGHIVHHIDGDRLYNSLDNLMVFESVGEHVAFHRRQELIAKGGVPGVNRWCPRCRTMKVLEDFHRAKTAYEGRCYVCKSCSSQRSRRRV